MNNREFFFNGITEAIRAKGLSFETEERRDDPEDPSLVVKVSGFELYIYTGDVLLCWYDGSTRHKRDCIDFESWEYKSKEEQLTDVIRNLDLALTDKVEFIAATYDEPEGIAGIIKSLLQIVTLGKVQLKTRRKPGTKS